MTVEELIEELKKLPGDAVVLVSGDEEWNRLNFADFASLSLMDPKSVPGDIEVVHPDDVEFGEYYNYEEEREMTIDDYTKAVVLW